MGAESVEAEALVRAQVCEGPLSEVECWSAPVSERRLRLLRELASKVAGVPFRVVRAVEVSSCRSFEEEGRVRLGDLCDELEREKVELGGPIKEEERVTGE